MSLIKFSNREAHRGQKVFWDRAEEDGLPFRGQTPPMYTQDEFEDKVRRVGDTQAEVFDLSDPVQKKAYLEVLDGVINGWFQCLYRKHLGSRKDPTRAFVRIEWVEYFLEDGTKSPFKGGTEHTHGSTQGTFPQF